MLTALLVSPVTAQRDTFGEIECTSLRIVDANGIARAGFLIAEHGGLIRVFGKDGKSSAGLSTDELGGIVFTVDRYGNEKPLD